MGMNKQWRPYAIVSDEGNVYSIAELVNVAPDEKVQLAIDTTTVIARVSKVLRPREIVHLRMMHQFNLRKIAGMKILDSVYNKRIRTRRKDGNQGN